MLTTIAGLSATGALAHAGQPLRPHDAWSAWASEPVGAVAIGVAGWLYARGWRPADGVRRAACWWTAWTTVVIALVSPVDAVAGVLLTAHMVQHVLLVIVAAPLFAVAAPGAALVRGLPGRLRRHAGSLPARVGITISTVRHLRHPAARWIAFVATFWVWHASLLYGAAIASPWVHALEHAAFLLTAFALWSVILGPRRLRLDRGAAAFTVFLTSLQSGLLATLLTFADQPFYDAYREPAVGWGLDPLTDQRLAGLIMWVPSGLVLAGIAVALIVQWLHELDAAGAIAPRP